MTQKFAKGNTSVAEVVPLKQGLKHQHSQALKQSRLRCRGSSIKTRIETHKYATCRRIPCCCRGSSIKTRIETVLD